MSLVDVDAEARQKKWFEDLARKRGHLPPLPEPEEPPADPLAYLSRPSSVSITDANVEKVCAEPIENSVPEALPPKSPSRFSTLKNRDWTSIIRTTALVVASLSLVFIALRFCGCIDSQSQRVHYRYKAY